MLRIFCGALEFAYGEYDRQTEKVANSQQPIANSRRK
jgi:hypothetical protein